VRENTYMDEFTNYSTWWLHASLEVMRPNAAKDFQGWATSGTHDFLLWRPCLGSALCRPWPCGLHCGSAACLRRTSCPKYTVPAHSQLVASDWHGSYCRRLRTWPWPWVLHSAGLSVHAIVWYDGQIYQGPGFEVRFQRACLLSVDDSGLWAK
jgi:hypothetical protein